MRDERVTGLRQDSVFVMHVATVLCRRLHLLFCFVHGCQVHHRA